MTIIAMFLYGSHARGNATPASDFDVMAVTSEGKNHLTVEGNNNFSFYTARSALKMASEGNLFIKHVLLEGRALYDPTQFLDHLEKSFELKENYDKEVLFASQLGWFIAKNRPFFQSCRAINKRITWCVRTILISRAADEGSFIFSADELAEYSKSRSARNILSLRNTSVVNEDRIVALRSFLRRFGSIKENDVPRDPAKAESLFRLHGNNFALKTLKDAIHATGSMSDYA